MKYTKEVLEIPVRESKSVSEVMRKLGLKVGGGSQGYLTKRIKDLGLDITHFLGQRCNRGPNHSGGPARLHWTQILVRERSTRGAKEASSRLREAMIESGIPHRCLACGCPPEWFGHPLVLQIDHINGDNLDNRRENLRFLCPNCHSQTETFGSKNIGRLTDAVVDEMYAWTGGSNLDWMEEAYQGNTDP